jgi:hypothetical protein
VTSNEQFFKDNKKEYILGVPVKLIPIEEMITSPPKREAVLVN